MKAPPPRPDTNYLLGNRVRWAQQVMRYERERRRREKAHRTRELPLIREQRKPRRSEWLIDVLVGVTLAGAVIALACTLAVLAITR